MPQLTCEGCNTTWETGVEYLIQSGYWPATLNFATIYEADLFNSFEDMKMASPGLSLQAFLRMLDKRTLRFGRVSILLSSFCSIVPFALSCFSARFSAQCFDMKMSVKLFYCVFYRLEKSCQTAFKRASSSGLR